MAQVQQNISLKPYNTFGIDANAFYFCNCQTEKDLTGILSDPAYKHLNKLVLGGGSNVLFTKNFNGLIILNSIKGKEIIDEDDNTVILRVGAGEDWDELVEYTVKNDLAGLENLSYIPGNVGASPIQNIGAYGEEVKNTISEVETIDLQTLKKINYKNEDCQFGYRSSIFKHELKGKSIITHVIFTLNKQHIFNLDYGSLNETVKQKGKVTLQNIRDSIIEIRKSKLPEPEELGSAGSFFKNPIIEADQYENLQQHFPNIPAYQLSENEFKVPAGWLIDQLGWKGYREGDAGVHKKQALVLVNYGNATGKQIYSLSQKIIQSVKGAYGIELEYEVNVFY
jgi:UDP-N-acetylmuramate dehydrogenase